MAASHLEQLKAFTTVVADTGDFESMRRFRPHDATTNPSLILAASRKPEYAGVLDRALAAARLSRASLQSAIDHVLVAFGLEILAIIPGRVSTEVDARLSFDTEGTVQKAREIVALYASHGVPRERILIKIASTWEGIRAAEQLERESIHCNLTLLFSLVQAVACAEAGVRLISPFVGRIYDWFKKQTGREYSGADDPGVQSVRRIYSYFKRFGYITEVMGASFRNAGQIRVLAGCDLLTISPELLAELDAATGPLERQLHPDRPEDAPADRIPCDERSFRWALNEDAMATEKTAEGIRRFAADTRQLEALLAPRL